MSLNDVLIMDVSYFLTLSNSRVTNELPTSYQRVTAKNTIILITL